MRLIDADALKKKITTVENKAKYKALQNSGVDFEGWKMSITTAAVLGNCKVHIDEEPTADAIPVSFLELLRDNARSAEAAEMITEILRLWDGEGKRNDEVG